MTTHTDADVFVLTAAAEKVIVAAVGAQLAEDARTLTELAESVRDAACEPQALIWDVVTVARLVTSGAAALAEIGQPAHPLDSEQRAEISD
jgi:hypothetical protein